MSHCAQQRIAFTLFDFCGVGKRGFDSSWHAARVQFVLCDSVHRFDTQPGSQTQLIKAKVLYVDYGNSRWVPRRCLYPLPEQFAQEPPQVSSPKSCRRSLHPHPGATEDHMSRELVPGPASVAQLRSLESFPQFPLYLHQGSPPKSNTTDAPASPLR